MQGNGAEQIRTKLKTSALFFKLDITAIYWPRWLQCTRRPKQQKTPSLLVLKKKWNMNYGPIFKLQTHEAVQGVRKSCNTCNTCKSQYLPVIHTDFSNKSVSNKKIYSNVSYFSNQNLLFLQVLRNHNQYKIGDTIIFFWKWSLVLELLVSFLYAFLSIIFIFNPDHQHLIKQR